MPKRHGDLTGHRFGKLVVIALTRPTGHRRWLCRCDCGGEKDMSQGRLLVGEATDCGCGAFARRSQARRSHGATLNNRKTPTYETWRGIKMRCDMPNNVAYHRYGGRGIKLCDRWRDFAKFVEDMGERPKGTTLDRIDVDGDYEPANCRWADHRTQSRNQSRTHLFETPLGPLSSTEISERTGAPKGTILRWRREGKADTQVWLLCQRYTRQSSEAKAPKAAGRA